MMEAGRAVSAPRAPAEELTARPLAPAAPVAGERDRERDELHREERFRERQPREDRAREDRPSDGRRRDERRGRSRDRDFRGERLGDEQPRRFDHSPSRSFAAVRPPSARMTEAQGIREGEAAGAPERGEFQGGRRPKRGRYSTGALFRPREKRVHRALGGEATTKWGWPEPEESAKPAGAPGPAGRRPEGRMLDERSNGPQRDEGDDD